jgi:hypothetical protein
MLATLDLIWVDRWDDYLDEYFMDWSMEYFDINAHEMMYIKEYVSDKGFQKAKKRHKYIYLQAEYFLNEPDIQAKLSLGCKVPIQRNDKE